ncbi:MAG: histidine kinase [Nitrospira sp.]|nr:histidine kinase [Nitrospira sp.]
MDQTAERNGKTVLVAVNDIFFYAKLRDALRGGEYTLERARTEEDVAAKADTAAALVINMNDDRLDAFRALEGLKHRSTQSPLPILAFANHEEVDTWRRAKELGATKVVSRNEFSARTRELVEEVIAASNQSSVIGT